MSLQLPLAITLIENVNFNNFNEKGNEFIVNLILQMIEGKSAREPLIYLVGGSEGMGCSHLLQATVKFAYEKKLQGVYLPMKELKTYSTEIFDQLEHSFIVCIDDLHAIIGNLDWEKALFDFYNRCYEKGAILLVSANKPYNYLNFCLPDLLSRFSSSLSYQMKDLPDDSKAKVLKYKAESRGLALSDEVINFLLKNYSRSLCKLVKVLDMLDEASLVEA